MAQAATTITQRKCKCNTMNANLPLIAAFINFIVFCFADTLSPEMQIYWENHMVQPYFDNTSKREVTAIAGQTCQLHCRVKSLGDRAVSWIRKRDLHILTVGILTYTNDQRFQSLHTDGSDEWTLRITSPQARDSGVYECQVSTEPKISQSFRLNVVVSKANILGNSELFVKSGSDINLTCEALQSPQPPSFIYWYKGGRVINYSQRGGISVLTEQQTRTSRLVIARASPSDSGNYTCAPSNSDSTSVVVHVIKGEHPAAMQHGINGANVAHTSTYVIISPNGSISVSVGAARHVDAEDSGSDDFGMLPASATFSTSVDGYGGLIGIIIVIIAITIAIDCNASSTIDKLRGIRNHLQRIQ